MTTEPTPYTVADLREWANCRRLFAVDGFHKNGSADEYLAQAAAFDALADGMEYAEQTTRLSAPDTDAYDVAYDFGRILSGVKP